MRRVVFVLKGMNFLWRTWLLPLLTSGSHTGFSISQSSLLRSLMHRGFPTLRNVLMTLVKDQKNVTKCNFPSFSFCPLLRLFCLHFCSRLQTSLRRPETFFIFYRQRLKPKTRQNLAFPDFSNFEKKPVTKTSKFHERRKNS